MATVFWNSHGIISINYLQRAKIITEETMDLDRRDGRTVVIGLYYNGAKAALIE